MPLCYPPLHDHEPTSFEVSTIKNGAQHNFVYTDFTKAFDRVVHKHLLWRSHIGVQRTVINKKENVTETTISESSTWMLTIFQAEFSFLHSSI